MYFYSFHIGDYSSHTRHLSPIEDIAYRRLLDLAYSIEKPIKNEIRDISRLINLRDYQQEILDVLDEFWELTDEGWINNRVLKEIVLCGKKSEKAALSAKSRWDAIKRERNANASVNHANASIVESSDFPLETDKSCERINKSCERNANASVNHANAYENDATHHPSPITHDPSPKIKQKPLAIGKPNCPHQEIINLYHSILPMCPTVRDWTPARAASLKARWNENEDRQKWDGCDISKQVFPVI